MAKTITADNGVSFKKRGGVLAPQKGKNGLYPSAKRVSAALKQLASNGRNGG